VMKGFFFSTASDGPLNIAGVPYLFKGIRSEAVGC